LDDFALASWSVIVELLKHLEAKGVLDRIDVLDVLDAAAQPMEAPTTPAVMVALRLGLTSFGGPIAPLGYFERTYVRERQWLTHDEYGGLVALCQMVPGPASSQVGYLVGLPRRLRRGVCRVGRVHIAIGARDVRPFALLAPHLEGPTTNAVLHGNSLPLRSSRKPCGAWRATSVPIGRAPLWR
jgi:Chromate transporter